MLETGRIHLIGIGGIGVSAVARALLAMGCEVSGSDVRESQITLALRGEGVRVAIGHDAKLIDGVDVVVRSTAIPETNPELVAAREKGVRVVHRAEVLGEILKSWQSIGVVGTHGKGTVSAMTTRILDAAGEEPSFVIGGLLNDYGCNARVTSGRWMVVEIDESDGSLVHVRPDTLVVNNLEADHLNYYGDLEAIYEKVGGVLADDEGRRVAVLHVGDEGVRELCRRLPRPIEAVRCGMADDLAAGGVTAEYVGTGLEVGPMGSELTILRDGESLGRVTVPQPGRYNAMNALVAATAAMANGVSFDAVRAGLRSYGGIENRFTVVEAGPYRVVKDYISHPTGIRRVLAAAKTLSGGPITAVFKPYRFTMIHYLGDEYAVAFRDAKHTVVAELYTAGEVPIPGVDVHWLIEKIRSSGSDVHFEPAIEDIPGYLLRRLTPGEQVIFFGGDDLFNVADAFVKQIRARL